MSEKTISPLRQRMIEDMSVRNFVEKTRDDYYVSVCYIIGSRGNHGLPDG